MTDNWDNLQRFQKVSTISWKNCDCIVRQYLKGNPFHARQVLVRSPVQLNTFERLGTQEFEPLLQMIELWSKYGSSIEGTLAIT